MEISVNEKVSFNKPSEHKSEQLRAVFSECRVFGCRCRIFKSFLTRELPHVRIELIVPSRSSTWTDFGRQETFRKYKKVDCGAVTNNEFQ